MTQINPERVIRLSDLTRFDDLRGQRRPLYRAAPDERPDVRYTVKGGVRRIAGGMRTIVHLIEHASGRYLRWWIYERSLTADDAVAWHKALGAEPAGHLAVPICAATDRSLSAVPPSRQAQLWWPLGLAPGAPPAR